MKFKIKRHWWIWALWILWHLFASCFLRIGIWQVLIAVIILDFLVIFPAASHFSYEIKNRQFTVKRIIYPDISFPCEKIAAVEHAAMFTAWGGRSSIINMNQIIEDSMGAYKITYITANHRRKSALACPKDREKFMNELRRNVDPQVILINNTESVFKKKKDKV